MSGVFFYETQCTSSFDFDLLPCHRPVILRRLLNFTRILPSALKLRRQCDLQDGGRQPCWICCRVIVDDPRTPVDSLSVIFKLQLDWLYNFGDTAIFRFWWKWPIRLATFAAHKQNQYWIYFRGGNWPDSLILEADLPIQHPTSRSVGARIGAFTD